MKRCLYYSLGIAVLGGILCPPGYLSAAETKDSPSSMPSTVSAFIGKNCAACHHPPNPPLGIDLTTLTFNLNDVDTYGRWVRIHDAVRDGKMPPGGGNVLKDADRAAFVSAVAEPMIAYENLRTTTEGRAVLRRLNRYEYE